MFNFFLTIFLILTPLVLYAVYLLVRIIQSYEARRQAAGKAICPECHSFVPLRYFLCNQCHTVNELIPTKKDVFYGNCRSCGRSLPKLPTNGRNDLTAICSIKKHKQHILGKNAGQFLQMAIPIVGNNSTGKTAFLYAWMVYAQTKLPLDYPVKVSFPFPGGNEFANKCKKQFAAGVNVARTSDRAPLGIGMDIVSNNGKDGLRAYFYDPAGEVFDSDSSNSLQPFHYYDFMNGCLFFIDPFATPGLRHRYNTASAGITASEKSIEDGGEKFIRGLYTHGLSRDEYHYAYCAVVITKADAFDLDSQIGDKAVRKAMSANAVLSYEDALNKICEQKLEQWGVGHVLRLLDDNFKGVRYFSVSSYGHSPNNGQPFIPLRVEMPILWLLRKQLHKSAFNL